MSTLQPKLNLFAAMTVLISCYHVFIMDNLVCVTLFSHTTKDILKHSCVFNRCLVNLFHYERHYRSIFRTVGSSWVCQLVLSYLYYGPLGLETAKWRFRTATVSLEISDLFAIQKHSCFPLSEIIIATIQNTS